MRLIHSIKNKLRAKVLPQPISVRHAEYSMLFSADDEPAKATPELIDLALKAIAYAKDASMQSVCSRMKQPPYFPDIWPGEGYKLLAGLTHVIAPKSVIEIGTAGGMSALAILEHLANDSTITTFDIIDWRSFDECILRDEDFTDGRLVQHLDNLADPDIFEKHRKLFEKTEMIFIDAPKDGEFERVLLSHLQTVHFETNPILVFDDIRLWNMLKIWREIKFPKLDLTSFGHWTGTGIVAWPKTQ